MPKVAKESLTPKRTLGARKSHPCVPEAPPSRRTMHKLPALEATVTLPKQTVLLKRPRTAGQGEPEPAKRGPGHRVGATRSVRWTGLGKTTPAIVVSSPTVCNG